MDQVEVIIIGAGVIGLACARQLAMAGHEVIILEAEEAIGLHTSSRNSEVIHAGIYYSPQSLKAKFCAAGNKKLYTYCKAKNINHQNIGKLIVATNKDEIIKLKAIQENAIACGVLDLEYLDQNQIKKMEPEIAVAAALYSPSTGIIDSHGFMLALLGDAEEHGAMLAVNSKVLSGKVEKNRIILQVGVGTKSEENYTISAKKIINCAGLYVNKVAKSITGIEQNVYFYKGNYFTLRGRSPFKHLIYPVPADGGLGIHSTMDLSGKTRFGPDVEFVTSLDYEVNVDRISSFVQSIKRYWPDVAENDLEPGYVGIRPKCIKVEDGKNDFMVSSIKDTENTGESNIINAYGIESPGLTASFGLAEYLTSGLFD